jgi:hypothetical protein
LQSAARCPRSARLQQLREGDRAIFSEPLGDLPGAWLEVPESTALTIDPGGVEHSSFKPR